MKIFVLNDEFMVQKGIFGNIVEWSYFGLLSYYIL